MTENETEEYQERPVTAQDHSLDTGLALFLYGLIFIVSLGFVMFSGDVLRDGDTGWHIAAGRYVVENGTVPTVDPFSFTFKGESWITHEWLAEVLMYAGFSAAGWGGLVIICGLAFAATLLILALYSLNWLTPLQATILVSITGLCLLPSSLARPHLLAWPILALWTVALLQARAKNTTPPIWVAAIMLVWANFHASYAIGLFLAGVFALEALVDAHRSARWDVIRTWAIFGLSCLAASVITPAGPAGLYYPLMVSTMEILPLIGEWQAPDFNQLNAMSVGLYGLVFFTLFKPVRLPLVRLLLLLFLLHMGLTHIRHVALFGIVGSLLLAEPLARAYRPDTDLRGFGLRAAFSSARHKPTLAMALLGIVIAGMIAARVAIPLQRPDGPGWPGAALASLPDELRTQRVFNEYSFGGALIQEGIPAFIDGRADMYGNQFVKDYTDISAQADAGKWAAADAEWHFKWVILRPEQQITAWIDQQAEWRKIYADDWAVIYVRD